MKTLIQKDLRENLKVALIGLLIFSLLLMQAYGSCASMLANALRGNWSGQVNSLQPLLSQSLLVPAAFFCALFGAALGWLQTRNEAHRDLWAFLIHRPLTRTEIFWGKTVAGLCLYVFGAGLPVLVLILVVRQPGHVAAPFEWEMTVPLVTIFLTGIAYYFAGLLTGLRQARWWVSRSFGLGPAIVASFGTFALPDFWMVYVLLLIVVVILATAAWGAYQSGGWYLGQPVAGKLALIISLAVGCAIVLLAGVGLTSGLLIQPFVKTSYEYSYYQMTREGEVYKVTMRDNETAEIVDLDGHPLMDPKTGQRMDRKAFQMLTAYGGTVITSLDRPLPHRNLIEDSGRFFNLLNITDKTLWYLDRHGKLVGYDGRSRKFIGTLEGHGFNGVVAADQFLLHPGGNYYYSYYNSYTDVPRKMLVSAKTVYQVDFKERSVRPVFTLTNDDEIGGYVANEVATDGNQVKKLLLTTRRTVQLLDSEGRSLLELPYQPGFAKYPQVELTYLPSTNLLPTYAVWFFPDGELNQRAHWTMPIQVRWIGPDQAITKTAELPTLQTDGTESWSSKLMPALLLPPLLHMELNRKMVSAWNLLNYAVAAMLAAIAWQLVRRHNASVKAGLGWTLFVFVLGIPGLLTLLVVQEWPVRETCPECQKPRAVDREDCEHCAATFAPPEKNGTEIFAPLVKT
ncbi:MAG TPA: hypothetical protein VK815_13520 [Candidatus Acidoferrales bacterium]|jgi:hypothetical protein|nr:hypothetical protein [Candidatus Acidoferrales bacterium]